MVAIWVKRFKVQHNCCLHRQLCNHEGFPHEAKNLEGFPGNWWTWPTLKMYHDQATFIALSHKRKKFKQQLKSVNYVVKNIHKFMYLLSLLSSSPRQNLEGYPAMFILLRTLLFLLQRKAKSATIILLSPWSGWNFKH